MNYGSVKYCDIANGEGVRTSLFVSGCRHRCRGCFQPETWDFSYGKPFTPEVAAEILHSLEAPHVDGLTVLGGEPFEPENQEAVAGLLDQVRERFPSKTVWIYTGDIYERLVDESYARRTPATDLILAATDILVDGPFVEDLKDISLRFRGSSNQRIIDLAATRAAGDVRLWTDEPSYAVRGI